MYGGAEVPSNLVPPATKQPSAWEAFADRVDPLVRKTISSSIQQDRVVDCSKCAERFSEFLQENGLYTECIDSDMDRATTVSYELLCAMDPQLQVKLFIAFGAWSKEKGRSALAELAMLKTLLTIAACNTDAFDSQAMKRSRKGLKFGESEASYPSDYR